MELLRAARSYEVALKGQSAEREEYGGFADREPVASIVEAEEAVVCGIAGDYCVGETLRNIVKMRGSSQGVKAYWNGTAFFDGGIRYGEILEELGVEKW
jgi:nicotinamidase/pyrazinamidase